VDAYLCPEGYCKYTIIAPHSLRYLSELPRTVHIKVRQPRLHRGHKLNKIHLINRHMDELGVRMEVRSSPHVIDRTWEVCARKAARYPFRDPTIAGPTKRSPLQHLNLSSTE
jgi:hypothetical protein